MQYLLRLKEELQQAAMSPPLPQLPMEVLAQPSLDRQLGRANPQPVQLETCPSHSIGKDMSMSTALSNSQTAEILSTSFQLSDFHPQRMQSLSGRSSRCLRNRHFSRQASSNASLAPAPDAVQANVTSTAASWPAPSAAKRPGALPDPCAAPQVTPSQQLPLPASCVRGGCEGQQGWNSYSSAATECSGQESRKVLLTAADGSSSVLTPAQLHSLQKANLQRSTSKRSSSGTEALLPAHYLPHATTIAHTPGQGQQQSILDLQQHSHHVPSHKSADSVPYSLAMQEPSPAASLAAAQAQLAALMARLAARDAGVLTHHAAMPVPHVPAAQPSPHKQSQPASPPGPLQPSGTGAHHHLPPTAALAQHPSSMQPPRTAASAQVTGSTSLGRFSQAGAAAAAGLGLLAARPGAAAGAGARPGFRRTVSRRGAYPMFAPATLQGAASGPHSSKPPTAPSSHLMTALASQPGPWRSWHDDAGVEEQDRNSAPASMGSTTRHSRHTHTSGMELDLTLDSGLLASLPALQQRWSHAGSAKCLAQGLNQPQGCAAATVHLNPPQAGHYRGHPGQLQRSMTAAHRLTNTELTHLVQAFEAPGWVAEAAAVAQGVPGALRRQATHGHGALLNLPVVSTHLVTSGGQAALTSLPRPHLTPRTLRALSVHYEQTSGSEASSDGGLPINKPLIGSGEGGDRDPHVNIRGWGRGALSSSSSSSASYCPRADASSTSSDSFQQRYGASRAEYRAASLARGKQQEYEQAMEPERVPGALPALSATCPPWQANSSRTAVPDTRQDLTAAASIGLGDVEVKVQSCPVPGPWGSSEVQPAHGSGSSSQTHDSPTDTTAGCGSAASSQAGEARKGQQHAATLEQGLAEPGTGQQGEACVPHSCVEQAGQEQTPPPQFPASGAELAVAERRARALQRLALSSHAITITMQDFLP